MFVFCFYTGLGFKEMANLKKQNITTEFDGELWLNIYRNKTTRTYKVPMLPKTKEIKDKYFDVVSEYVFPKMSNTKFNTYNTFYLLSFLIAELIFLISFSFALLEVYSLFW